MTEIFLDGMDKYANTTEVQIVWTVTNGTWNFASSGGRFGGGALEATATSTFFTKDLPSHFVFDGTTAFNIGFSFKAASAATANGGSLFNLGTDGSGGSGYNAVSAGSTGTHLQYWSKLSSTSVQGTATVLDGNWHWIEVQWVFSNTTSGSMTAYVDGVLDAQATGLITMPFGNTSINTVIFQPGNAAGNTVHDAFLDDVHIWNSLGTVGLYSFPLGPARIYTSAPTSNGDSVQYTPSTGTNYSCVNQGFSASTNVTDTTTGHVDIYHFLTMAANSYTINTVAMNYYGQNSGSGTASLIPQCKTNLTQTQSSTQTWSVAVNTNHQGFFGVDATGAAWTYSNVNASQFGQGD